MSVMVSSNPTVKARRSKAHSPSLPPPFTS
jgi:hypothetical protein